MQLLLFFHSCAQSQCHCKNVPGRTTNNSKGAHYIFGVKNLLSWGLNHQPLGNQLDALTTPLRSARLRQVCISNGHFS